MQISCDTKIIDATFEEITSESQVRTNPQTVKKSKGDMYTTRDVAKILKVDEKTIRKWRTEKIFGCDILSEDMIDHNGVCYYFRDKIDQLAKVFRKDWRTAWAKPNDKSENVSIVSTNQNIKAVEKNYFFNDDPHNIEMEKFVLGSMLLKDGLIIPDVAAILSPDDFYRPEHKLIYNSILKLYHTKVTPNILSLVEDLRTSFDDCGKNLLDKIEIGYVLALTEIAHTTAYSIDYAKKIKEKSEHRKLIRQAEIIVHDAQIGLKSPLDIIADTTNAFNEFKINKGDDFFDVADYLKHDFSIEIADDFKFFDRKSGFSNIDDKQHWKPGLYILGATPACGKTTFAWQLLEQFAENGENCFFCSYEMTKKELAAKTLARRLFKDNPKATLTAADILNGGFSNGLTDAAFFDNKNINFVVKKFSDEDVNTLLAILRPRIKDLDRPPIICIDYIQRLIPRVNKFADTRSMVDEALYKLKDFANETNALILGISTFNRTNYNLPPSFENFKESGGIEYTADVVFSMQLDITNKLSGENIGDIRNKIEGAKLAQPRQISFKCLKNRLRQ